MIKKDGSLNSFFTFLVFHFFLSLFFPSPVPLCCSHFEVVPFLPTISLFLTSKNLRYLFHTLLLPITNILSLYNTLVKFLLGYFLTYLWKLATSFLLHLHYQFFWLYSLLLRFASPFIYPIFYSSIFLLSLLSTFT